MHRRESIPPSFSDSCLHFLPFLNIYTFLRSLPYLLPRPLKMPVALVNGIEISYIIHKPSPGTAAQKAHVVLINGLADEKESWAYQIDDLTRAGYEVLAFDNRGIGKTSNRKFLLCLIIKFGRITY